MLLMPTVLPAGHLAMALGDLLSPLRQRTHDLLAMLVESRGHHVSLLDDPKNNFRVFLLDI